MPDTKHLFVKYVIAGQIQREWVFLRDGKFIPDRLGGNLTHALCGAALWDDRIGILTKHGGGLPEQHYRWLQNNAIIDGLLQPDNEKTKCQLLNFEEFLENDINPVKVFSRKGIQFPKELIGIDYKHNEDETSLMNQSFYESDIPLNYRYASMLLVEQMPLNVQSTLPMVLRRSSSPYVILNPSREILKLSNRTSIPLLLSGVNCLIVRESDLRQLFGRKSNNILVMLEGIENFCIEAIIIKLQNGQYLSYDALSKKCKLIPAYMTAPIDSTGVDGAFDGGFMAGMQITFNPDLATVYGAVSASVCSENESAMGMLLIHKKLLFERLDFVRDNIKEYSTRIEAF